MFDKEFALEILNHIEKLRDTIRSMMIDLEDK